jgi:hypothetical protein
MTSTGEGDLVGMARVLLDANVIIDLMGRGLPIPTVDKRGAIRRVRRGVVMGLVRGLCRGGLCITTQDVIYEAVNTVIHRFAEYGHGVGTDEVMSIINDVLRLYSIGVLGDDDLSNEDLEVMAWVIEELWNQLVEGGDPCGGRFSDDDAVNNILNEFLGIKLLAIALSRDWHIVTTDCGLACCLPVIIGNAVWGPRRMYDGVGTVRITVEAQHGTRKLHAIIMLIAEGQVRRSRSALECCTACCVS